MMPLHRGQEVICIDDMENAQYFPTGITGDMLIGGMDGLKKGRKYSIRETGAFMDILWCRLEEIIRPIDDALGVEAFYNQARFRPVKKVETDISIFTSMLTKITEKVD
jgi:hypothetical protein